MTERERLIELLFNAETNGKHIKERVADYLLENNVFVAPVCHGHWNEIVTHNGCTPDYDCVCSICKKSGVPTYNYCPNCGAKMDGDKNV